MKSAFKSVDQAASPNNFRHCPQQAVQFYNESFTKSCVSDLAGWLKSTSRFSMKRMLSLRWAVSRLPPIKDLEG